MPTTDTDTEPPEGWPTQPVRIADNLEALMAQLARTRAAHEEAKRRHPGVFEPDPEDDVSPLARQQATWQQVVRVDDHRYADLPNWRLRNLHVRDVVPHLERWVADTRPLLVLVGPNGCGKTRAAAATLHACWQGGRQVLFRRAADLVEDWIDRRSDEGRELRQLVARARYAVIDDLGRSAETDLREAALLDVWDRLADNGCRIIVTTNLNAAERTQQLGPAMASRVGTKNVLNFPADDLRGRGLPVPLVPATGPCPFHCTPQGAVFLDDLVADGFERMVDQLHRRGIHPPEDDRYPTSPEGNAMLAKDKAWYDARLDHMGAAIVWCPHCRPERQGDPLGGMRRLGAELAELGSTEPLPADQEALNF